MLISRFRFPTLLMIGLPWILAFASTDAADTIRIRRDEITLSSQERQLFVDAIYAMKAAPARGNGILATNRYDEYVRLHELYRIHMNSGFLPWHRKMLWEFETEIRQLDPARFGNFTLPYWNWNYFPVDLVGSGGTPFVTDGPFAAGLWTTLTLGPSGTNALERNYFEIDEFAGNGGAEVINSIRGRAFETMSLHLEIYWHNYAHIAIGGEGQLGTIAGAVDDPFFWLLHSWVDMVWTQWQASTGTTSANGYMKFMDGPGIDDRLDGFGDGTSLTDIGFNDTMFNTVRDQLDPRNMASLGYNYEFLRELVLPPVVVPEPGSLVLTVLSTAALAGYARIRRGRQRRCGTGNSGNSNAITAFKNVTVSIPEMR